MYLLTIANTTQVRIMVLVISAPSGTGKTSLIREILKTFPYMKESVSYTTRLPRADEVEGESYHFISQEAFDTMTQEGRFVEWAEVHGNRYGTAFATIEAVISNGIDLVLDIDYQGAAQLKKRYPNGVSVFILPPSIEELRRRLESRGTDTREVIERRIVQATEEIKWAEEYDYIITNDDFDTALQELCSVVVASGSSKLKEHHEYRVR